MGGPSRHGHWRNGRASPTYASWMAMRVRCANPKHPAFARYGGRGITICERWQSFENFLADMGERPVGTSLDRINNDGHYEPGNCRWATPREQSNNMTANRRIALRGVSHTVTEWAEITGILETTLRQRLACGWSAERALCAPVRPHHRREGGRHG